MIRRLMRRDEGAAAVEFAFVLPVLILLLLGLIEFSRLYNIQISVSNAAREAARTMAIENSVAAAQAAGAAAAPALNPQIAAGQITVTPADCAAGGTATAAINYPVTLMTGFFFPNITLNGTGAMRCGG